MLHKSVFKRNRQKTVNGMYFGKKLAISDMKKESNTDFSLFFLQIYSEKTFLTQSCRGFEDQHFK